MLGSGRLGRAVGSGRLGSGRLGEKLWEERGRGERDEVASAGDSVTMGDGDAEEVGVRVPGADIEGDLVGGGLLCGHEFGATIPPTEPMMVRAAKNASRRMTPRLVTASLVDDAAHLEVDE